MAKKMIRRVEPTEHQIQAAIVEWANVNNYEGVIIGGYLLAIPNGGYRHIAEAKKLKKEGVKAGVSDLFLAIPKFNGVENPKFPYGLWIEVKALKGKISENQKLWNAKMNCIGYATKIVRTVDEGIQAIKDYLGMR